MFLSKWRSKDSVFLKFKKCDHRDDTSIIDGNQGVVLIAFFVERPSKKMPPLGGGIELCGNL